MSKSRLEKFLYALYSLDSSDLPNPLSRIEELYKCLVTGDEAPTFEPISRVEKYLMAILGGYDINSLPNPLSRVEVLLYKLATGDDNLDDIKSFLSEHEELLAEIIRNGGAGGNIDIEYVLYYLSTEFNTLYNTAEKPVKSAILKGQTLVNVNTGFTGTWGGMIVSHSEITSTGRAITTWDFNKTLLESNTRYLISCDCKANLTINKEKGIAVYCDGVTSGYSTFTNGLNSFTFTTGDLLVDNNRVYLGIQLGTDNVCDVVISNIMIIKYQEGMENWNIPYFEGMQSVKMPVLTTTGGKNFSSVNSGSIKKHTGVQENHKITDIKLAPNEEYTLSFNSDISTLRFFLYDETGTEIFQKWEPGSRTFQTNECENYYLVIYTFYEGDYTFSELQIEQGSVATPYEPYKSNILTVNEEVELRGVGDVKDELNLITGELTQRIGEIVLDGSGFYINKRDETSITFVKDGNPTIAFMNRCINNRFSNLLYVNGTIHVNVNISEFADINEFKESMAQNNLIIQFHKKDESIKTVDLSVVDQDGNDTKLSTFDDITHVTLSSEGLIPEAELEVATKNEEDLEDSIVYATHTLSEEFNTLYNTAKKPVKSAILKGNTLVNLQEKGTWVIGDGNLAYYSPRHKASVLKTNTKYIIYFTNLPSTAIACYFDYGINNRKDILDNRYSIFTTGTDISRDYYIHIYTIDDGSFTTEELANCHVMIIEYQDGMENWDIPYFEGMQSVKMPVLTTTGKNLFDGRVGEDKKRIISTGVVVNDSTFAISEYISISPNKNYICNKSGGYGSFYDSDKKLISTFWNSAGAFAPQNARYVRISFEKTNMDDLQFEENSTSTSYEPYKSNILTTNEEVELRGVGDVKDELDVVTGKLTQRIGEYIYMGENNVSYNASVGGYLTIVNVGGNVGLVVANGAGVVSDKLLNKSFNVSDVGVYGNLDGRLYIYDKTVNSAEEFITKHKGTTFVFVLKEPSVKTVDLSVVDQDGNNTKLSTFNDITHVTLSSEGLIPEAELEVAEKVPEVAASMLTISREQEVINTTTNEQSENVDATMIATTEIYEGLL